MPKLMLAPLVRNVAAWVGLALSLTGCPVSGDCWGTADIAITVAPQVDVPSSPRVIVAEVFRIQPGDVTGTTADGLPVGPNAEHPNEENATYDVDARIGTARYDMTDPYPVWYYAFIDLNDNGHLDSGEPFGVDPRNPSTTGDNRCGNYSGSIVIDKTLP
jgi:hypothetical protein